MKFELPGIILNNKLHSVEELKTYAATMMAKNIPVWEYKIFSFIHHFLDDKEYIIQQSSGTTGTPKTFQLSKKAMLESARLTSNVLGLKYGQSVLLCLSADYIAGKMIIVRALLKGLQLFWEEPGSLPALHRYEKIHFCSMVPMQAYNLFKQKELLQNIDVLLIGGAEIRPELRTMFSKINNHTYETYGMAESCSHIALKRISGPHPDQYFKTLPGIQVSADQRNCLIAQISFLNKALITNDVVEIINDTTFAWKCRYDNLINTGGLKVIPEELEAAIAPFLLQEFAIIGIPDEKMGQKITLVIESVEKINENELLKNLFRQLESYKIPKAIMYVKELPRNAAFKIERKKLQRLFS